MWGPPSGRSSSSSKRRSVRLPRITFLVLTLAGLDLAAAVGALIVFQEIPPHLFGLVTLAASGGGGQLVGAAVGGLAARRSLGRAS